VTDFYASSIVNFVRKILAIIPSSVFGILTQIVDIKEKKLAILPLKVEVDVLQEYSQAEDRYALARLTHELSIFTEGKPRFSLSFHSLVYCSAYGCNSCFITSTGILSMEKTTIGKIKLDPRRLLEDGIRAELTLKVSEALHQNLQFDVLHETTPDELVQYHASVLRSLKKLSSRMECFRRSIEFVQDYIGIPGLKVWFQEVSRVIEFNVR
jgi:WASH complex subunit strumpellin